MINVKQNYEELDEIEIEKVKEVTWSALRWEILNSILSLDFADLCLWSLNILSFWKLSLHTSHGVNSSLWKWVCIEFYVDHIHDFDHLLHNHHHQLLERERERELAKWSLLWRVLLFYCSFKLSRERETQTNRKWHEKDTTTDNKGSVIGIIRNCID